MWSMASSLLLIWTVLSLFLGQDQLRRLFLLHHPARGGCVLQFVQAFLRHV